MECGRAIEEDGVTARDLFENVPDFGRLPLDHLLGRANGVDIAEFFEPTDDERLEEHQRHLLGQAALMQLELRPDHDDGTARVIDTFAEQVLAEAATLAFEHIAQGLERAIACAGHGAAMASIIEQGIDRFLEHALFVADDHFRRFELEQVLQPIIPVDDATIEIVEIGGSEAATFERDERTEVRRNHRQDDQDHPLGPALRGLKPLKQLDALGDLLANLFALGLGHRDLEQIDLLTEIDAGQGITHRFSAHFGDKGFGTVSLSRFAIFMLAEKLVLLERRRAGIDHHVILVIDDALEIASSHVKDQTDARGHAFEEPDMADGYGQLDMAHALAANAGERHFDTAAVANDTTMFDALILSAGAFPVLYGAENTLAEQAALFRLE